MQRAVAEFRDHAGVGVGIHAHPGRDARVARLLAERERGRERHRILIDDERQLDDAARVAFRQFGRKRHWHNRGVLGAHRRLERHEAFVFLDWRVVEKEALEFGPGIRLIDGLSESASARRTTECETGQCLSSGEHPRHRSASIPSVDCPSPGLYWSHSNSE